MPHAATRQPEPPAGRRHYPKLIRRHIDDWLRSRGLELIQYARHPEPWAVMAADVGRAVGRSVSANYLARRAGAVLPKLGKFWRGRHVAFPPGLTALTPAQWHRLHQAVASVLAVLTDGELLRLTDYTLAVLARHMHPDATPATVAAIRTQVHLELERLEAVGG